MTENLEKKRKQDEDEEHKQKKVLFVLNFYPLEIHDQHTMYAVFTSSKDMSLFDRICKNLRADMSKVYDSPWHEELIDSTHTWFPFVEFMCFKGDNEDSRRAKAFQLMMPLGKITQENLNSDDTGKDFHAKDIGTLQFAKNASQVMKCGAFDSVIVVHPHCNKEKLNLYNAHLVNKLDI